ncbi:DUF6571 family protein [Actinomyces sp. 565]|uniref:DUF6571 family protein n=1 Tax=Actinomyces sp. 565 TaxID=2057794 RepID=UPI0013A6D732|nr:DUF6571 family protein [Actinomyces sp. 565]NDR54767.1 hypothetical protein [Actinomyces sp. 565]
MAVLYLNPDKLATAIQDLRDFADDCSSAITSINNKCTDEHNPIDITDFRISANNAIGAVNARADQLAKAKDAIVAVNDSGVGSMTADGGISCEVPDGTVINTVADLTAWSHATIDAHDLQAIIDGSPGFQSNGRTYDQVIAAIRERSGDPAYAAALVNALGPENLTSLPFEVQEHYTVSDDTGKHDLKPEASTELAELLGTVLASASTTWDNQTCESMATIIKESVDDKGEWGRITVLNAMLGGHDADSNHVNDLEFNSAFLTALANSLDDIDWNAIKSRAERATDPNTDSYTARYDKKDLGPYLGGQSFDPLAGVLDAMGNNPRAALDYLAKASESGDGADMTLLEELSKRDWDEQGFAGFTAALAAASSQRPSDDPTTRRRADNVAGYGIHYLVANTDEEIYNDDAKARIGVLLANCPAELTSAWVGEDAPGDPDRRKELPEASVDDINKLTYRVSDSTDAVATIAAQLGEYANNRAQHRIEENTGDPDAQILAINNAYRDVSKAVGTLAGMADSKADALNVDSSSKAAAHSQAAKTAISVLTTVAGAGLGSVLPGGTAGGAKTGLTIANTVLSPLVNFDADQVESAAPESLKENMWAAAVQDAANAGLLNPDDYTIDTSDSGVPYSWMVSNEDGSRGIDISAAGEDVDVPGQMRAWSRRAVTITNDPMFDKVTDDFDESYTSGYDSGSKYGG